MAPLHRRASIRNQQPKRRMLQFHAAGTFLVCPAGAVRPGRRRRPENHPGGDGRPSRLAGRFLRRRRSNQAIPGGAGPGRTGHRQAPQRSNLYLVRNRMLSAAAGMALLKEDEPSRKRVTDLAQAALDSKPPADARLLPEFLLLQQKLVSGAIAGDQARKAIQAFIAAYQDSPLAPSSLICASMLALPAGLDDMREGPASILDKNARTRLRQGLPPMRPGASPRPGQAFQGRTDEARRNQAQTARRHAGQGGHRVLLDRRRKAGPAGRRQSPQTRVYRG